MIKFGTSGFRGVMGDNFTRENVARIGFAITKIIKEDRMKNPVVAIGYDNRFMSDMYAKWLSEALCPYAHIIFYDIAVPTPLICWKTKQVDFGIVLTASHNPFYYNGVKIFLNGARECDDEFAHRVEIFANSIVYSDIETIDFNKAVEEGRIELSEDYQTYCASILKLADVSNIKKSKVKVLANAMHGNSTKCVEYLFKKLGLKTSKLIKSDIDPFFEHKLPAPYVQNLTEQAKMVVKGKYDFGVAFDGDSDRFTLIDKTGIIYDCNYVFSVLYHFYVNYKGYKGSAVKNIALSNLVKFVAKDAGFDCIESKVGFKHISPVLTSTDAFIGAESNGVAFRDHILSKDGIFVFVAIVDAITTIGKSFGEILEELQTKYNFKSEIYEFAYPISDDKKKEIKTLLFEEKKYPVLEGYEIENVDERDGCKINYVGGYWGNYRFSGNEPVVRIFAEMKDKKECDKLFACYEDFIGVHVRQ